MVRKPKKQKKKSGQPKHRMNNVHVGVAWYETEADWKEIRAFAFDPDHLEETYQEWLAGAEKALKEFALRGAVAEKVYLDAKTLKEWCRNSGKVNDASTRAELAAKLLKEKYEQKK